MSTYLRPKEDTVVILPHSRGVLHLKEDQVWMPLKRFQSSDNVIGYALEMEGDPSPSAYLFDLHHIEGNFFVISEGEELPPLSVKRALDAMIDHT